MLQKGDMMASQTNADKIRHMNDRELAEFIRWLDSGLDRICERMDVCQDGTKCRQYNDCIDCYVEWLYRQDLVEK